LKCKRCGTLHQLNDSGYLYYDMRKPPVKDFGHLCVQCQHSFMKWVSWVNPDEAATHRWFARSVHNGRKKLGKIKAGGHPE